MICTPENQEIRQSLFIAGTIDNGQSENWQEELCNSRVKNWYDIYSPRTSMTPEQYQDPKVGIHQIEWEQHYINRCDKILFNFLPNSKSPITLMELGFALGRGKQDIIVVCPTEYWKYLNVERMCKIHDAHFYTNMEDALSYLFWNR